MKCIKTELGEEYFSPIFLDYLNQKVSLSQFYNLPPSLENFAQIIENRKFEVESREILVNVLNEQYKIFENPGQTVQQNLEKLKNSRTFTVTTGHQLNIFTGPLYFIYKIVTTINLAKTLKKAYPDYHFVPVYWMASEDHDLAEINHFHLFGKKYAWETDHTGPVGRLTTDGIASIARETEEEIPAFEKAYQISKNLSEATRRIVHDLFGDQGLVILDADEPLLKGQFREIMKDDLLKHQVNKLVQKSNQELEKLDYPATAYVREINLFYLEDGLRERIEEKDGRFEVLNRGKSFSQEELLNLLEKTPEKLSPNVLMRPLYQEQILPNLAYIGGPSEIAYWLQLKPVFDHYHLSFPLLMPRNFGMVINKSNLKKMKKLDLEPNQLFKDLNYLKNQFLQKNTNGLLDLDQEKEMLAEVFNSLKEKARAVDQSLEGWIGSEENKSEKSLINIQKRLKKAEEKRNETALQQLESLKEKLFPENTLQERHDNFLNFYLNQPRFLDFLLEQFDPFDFRFHIFLEDD